MVDVVFFINAKYSNIENESYKLQLCLRSIEKFATGYRNIYIIGEKPLFKLSDNVVYVKWDFSNDNNELPSIYSLLDNYKISSYFLHIPLGIIFCKGIDLSLIKYDNNGSLPGKIDYTSKEIYNNYKLLETKNLLDEYDLPTFDISYKSPTLFSRPLLRSHINILKNFLLSNIEINSLIGSIIIDNIPVDFETDHLMSIYDFGSDFEFNDIPSQIERSYFRIEVDGNLLHDHLLNYLFDKVFVNKSIFEYNERKE